MPVGAYAVASDTGRRRRRNEDNYVVAPPLFGVADGMGGAQAGEVASQLATSALEAGDSEALEGTKRLDALIQEANRRIYDRASTDPTASGMGTTMTVALVEGMTVAIGHVGDSRAYLVRDEQTREYPEGEGAGPGDTMVIPPGEMPTAVSQPAADARRVRLVLIGIVVVALAAVLLIWGLSR